MKFPRYPSLSFFIIILLSLFVSIKCNPIEEKQKDLKQEQSFSKTLKNSALASSVASASPSNLLKHGDDDNDNNNGGSPAAGIGSLSYFRQIVNRLLRALSSTINNHVSNLDSDTSDKRQEEEDETKIMSRKSFRFPEEEEQQRQQEEETQVASASEVYSPMTSLRTSRLIQHQAHGDQPAQLKLSPRTKMGIVERVPRPTFESLHQRPSTNFNIPSRVTSSVTFTSSPLSQQQQQKQVSAPTSSLNRTSASSSANTGTKNPEDAQRAIKYGKPSTIQSQPLFVTDGTSNRGDGKRGRSLKTIDVQGVKIIVGERVPDDPEDKFFTWRNARVIKGVLVPNNGDDQVNQNLDNSNRNNKMLSYG